MSNKYFRKIKKIKEKSSKEKLKSNYNRFILNPKIKVLIQNGNLKNALEYGYKIKDQFSISYTLEKLAKKSFLIGDLHNAIDYSNQAKRIYDNLDYIIGVGRVLTIIGRSNALLGNFQLGLENLNFALRIFQKINNIEMISEVFMNLANIYSLLNNHKQAIFYNKKLLNLHIKMENKLGIAQTLGNIGSSLQKSGQFQEALDYQMQSLKIKIEINNEHEIAITCSNIGAIYRTIGDFKKSVKYLRRALILNRKVKNKHGVALSLGNIGNLYGNLKKYSKALNYQWRALRICYEENYSDIAALFCFNIGSSFQQLGKFFMAELYFTKSLKLYRSLLITLKSTRLQTMFQNNLSQIIAIIRNLKTLKFNEAVDNVILPSNIEIVSNSDDLINVIDEIINISNAKNLFDYKMTEIELIIKYIKKFNTLKKSNKKIELILIQQIIIIQINSIELYSRLRFIELNNEGVKVNLTGLYKSFLSPEIRDRKVNEIRDLCSFSGMTELESLIYKKYINFQKWDNIMKAYLIGYDLNIRDTEKQDTPGKNLNIEDYINLRQKFVHSFITNPLILAYNEKDRFEKMYLNIELAEYGYKMINNFINNLHNLLRKIKNDKIHLKYNDHRNYTNELEKFNTQYKKENKIFKIPKEYYEKLSAIEIANQKFRDIELLMNFVEKISISKPLDNKFRTIILKQIFVMLTTIFEIYFRKRFLELIDSIAKDELNEKMKKIYRVFIRNYERENIKKIVNKISKYENKSELLVLIERNRINFQVWGDFKRAYKIIYNITVGDLFNGEFLFQLQKLIEIRHIIIHSKFVSTISILEQLKIEESVNLKNIVFSNIENLKKFILKFHDCTRNLKF